MTFQPIQRKVTSGCCPKSFFLLTQALCQLDAKVCRIRSFLIKPKALFILTAQLKHGDEKLVL
jgi:hypothetical protein